MAKLTVGVIQATGMQWMEGEPSAVNRDRMLEI